MLNPRSTTRSPDATWAEVRVHDRVMRYRRSGAGRAVLLLHDGRPDALWPELAESLATRFRLIAPELPERPASGISTHRWLGEFLEGLGTSSVALLATDPFCIDALELALAGAEQIASLLLVVCGEDDAARLGGSLATWAGDCAVPLRVLRRGMSAADATALATAFLSGEEGGPPA
jgi:hypothetical protein